MAKKKENEEKKKYEIEELEGVGPATCEKLVDSGLSTFMSIATSSPGEIASVSGVSEATARKIIKNAREQLKLGFEAANEYSKRRDNIKKIGTGCESFDNMLAGGLESGCITEVYGSFGTGKTQLAHLLAVRALLEDKNNKVIYVDSENTFRADRIRDFANANKIDPEDALSRVYVSRSFNSDHQMLLIDEVEKMLQEDKNYRVIIVDSLTSHFRSDFTGRGELATRQQKLNKHMHQLLKLADMYNLVVLVSNQVMSSPGVCYGDPTIPIGGHIVGHASTFRIYLRPGKAGSIHAKLIDSPNLPISECDYKLVKDGFEEI